MADLKISALNSLAGADLVAADVVAVVDDSASETKKLTVSDLIANGVTLISNSTIPSAKILFSAGSVATASVADAGITTAKVADSAITAAKLADNSSVTLVSTLPGSGDFTGQIALDTDDNKIYIWDGSAWDSVKGAGSINVVNGSTSGIVNITTSTSGDTVTVSTTLDDTSTAAQFLAGPTGSGGTVGYRAIIGTDLPTASSSAKGGVIVNGNGLAMSGDTITVNNSVTAETSENHIVQYDANGLITGGRAIVAGDVPVATSSATGAVKPGSGLEVTGAGAINHSNSVSAATAAKVTFDAQGHITASEALAASDVPDLDASKITTGTLPTARLANDAVTADKLGDKSTTTIAETTPAGGTFIGQGHLNSISGDFLIWDGNVWQPIGVSVGEIVLAGTYNASTNKMATVTSEGTSLSYVVGSALPTASASNKGYYVVVSTAGTGTSPAPTVALNPPDFLLSTGTAYTEIDVSSTVVAQQASNVAFTAAGNIASTNVQAAIEELDSEKVGAASPTFTGTVALGEDAVITFEGATDNAFETTLTVVDPTADRTVSLPNVTGTLISSGDTGSVTSAMIADGAIVNADINASAEIAVSKLANGTARQLLQTDVAGTGVEFTSNVDVPGTLDVTGAATLDSTLAVTGATTVTGVINADGKVKFPAGSASAPSFYSGTDTNTGLYFSAADEVSITTGGTQRVVVDSSGNAGIGVSSPTSVLDIRDTQTGAASEIKLFNLDQGNTTTQTSALVMTPDLRANGAKISVVKENADFSSSANKDVAITFSPVSNNTATERLRIDSSGRLLVGATSSTTLANTSTVQISASDSNAGLSILRTASAGGVFQFGAGSSGDNVSSGDALGYIKFTGYHTNGYDEYARITAEADGTTGDGDAPGRLVFSTTADGASSPTDRMQIDSSGRVLIGATTEGRAGATDNLTIADSGDCGITIRSGTSNDGAIDFSDSTSGDGEFAGQILYDHGSNFMRFITASSERLRIDSSGRLLLNTTTEGDSSADDLTVANSTHCGITIRSGTTSFGSLYFSDATSGTSEYDGFISYSQADRFMQFGTASTNRVRIDSSGNVLVGKTTTALTTAGTRISSGFITGSASSSSTNLSANAGAAINLANTNSTDNNFSNIGGYNSNGLVVNQINLINESHSSRTGAIAFSTHNGSNLIEAMRIDSKQRVTVKAGAIAEIDTLTSASTVTPDFATSCNFTLTLGTNVTLANPSNVTAGQSGSIFLVQDGTGSRTLTLGSNYDFAGGTAPTLSTAANAVDRLDYIVRTSTSIHCVVTLAYS